MTTDTLRAAAQNDEVGALIDRLEALADPEKEAVPSFADTDWRSLSWTCAKALRAALAAPVQEPTQSLSKQMQQMCSDWGTYWRAPDAHGVNLTHEQALELLQFALGVEVDIAAPQAAPAVPAPKDVAPLYWPEFPPFPTWIDANDLHSLQEWAQTVRRDAFAAGLKRATDIDRAARPQAGQAGQGDTHD